MALKVLGMARVLKDTATGKLVVDKTTLRRGGSGGRRTEGEDEDVGDEDSEDFGDEDSEETGDEDSDDLGDEDDLGEDEDLGDEDDLGDESNEELADDLGVEADMDDELSGRRGKRNGRGGGKKRPGQSRRKGRR